MLTAFAESKGKKKPPARSEPKAIPVKKHADSRQGQR